MVQPAQAFAPGIGMLIHIAVIDVLGDVGEQFAADFVAGAVENDDVDRHVVFHEKRTDGIHRHTKRLILGIAEDPGGDQREGHRFASVFLCQSKASMVCEEAPPVFMAAPSAPMAASAPGNLDDLLDELDAGFSETLLKLIDRTGKKDAEIYKKANVDRKLFSKIRNNPDYKPSKTTAVAFAIALELDLEETRDFIARAGFALSRSSKFDIIIEYFIQQKNYDVFAINEALFAFDQSLLGA